MLMITSITYSKYKALDDPNDKIIYYINNTKQKNIFFKGKNRYYNAMVIDSINDIPKPGDREFVINKIYYIPSTGKAIKYISNNKIIEIQKEYGDTEEIVYPNMEVVKHMMGDSSNSGESSGGSNNGGSTGGSGGSTTTPPSSCDCEEFGVYVVSELPKTNIKKGIYLVKSLSPSVNNQFIEYLYVNKAWERISGETSGELAKSFVTFDRLTEIMMSYYTKDDTAFRYYSKTQVDQIVTHLLGLINGEENIPDLPEPAPEPDLTEYLKITEFLSKMNEYYTKEEISELFKNYLTIGDIEGLENIVNDISSKLNNFYTIEEVDEIVKDIVAINDMSSYLKIEDFETRIKSYYTASTIDSYISNLVSKSIFETFKTDIIDRLAILEGNVDISDIQNQMNQLSSSLNSNIQDISDRLDNNYYTVGDINNILNTLNPNPDVALPDFSGYVSRIDFTDFKRSLEEKILNLETNYVSNEKFNEFKSDISTSYIKKSDFELYKQEADDIYAKKTDGGVINVNNISPTEISNYINNKYTEFQNSILESGVQ